jgi:AcrR family transcriptional regulator
VAQERLLRGESTGSAKTDRREAILDAATVFFAERGLAGVSIQEIADTAGSHKTTVLYHFATKNALYDTVLDQAIGDIAGVMQDFLAGGFDSTHLRERVAYMLDQIQAHFAEHPAHARLLARELLEQAPTSAYISQFVERIYLPAVASIEQAVSKGLIRPIDPALFIHDLHVELIGYFCHGSLLERLMPGEPFSIEALIDRRNHLVDQIFLQLRPAEVA